MSPYIYSADGSSTSPFGPQAINYGNGVNSLTQYDTRGRLQSRWICPGAPSANCAGGYGYTQAQSGSQVQSVYNTVVARSTDFHYDDLGRLASSSSHAGAIGLNLAATYDRYGNRWSQTITNTNTGASPNTSFSFNAGTNQISGFAYDALGNLMSDGFHTYQYDEENNLVSVDGGSTASYTYDAGGLRVKANVGGVIDRYGLDLAGRRSTTWLDNSTS